MRAPALERGRDLRRNGSGQGGGSLCGSGEQPFGLRARPAQRAGPVGGQQVPPRGVERAPGALGGPRVGEVRAQAREKLVEHDGLGHIIDPAGLEALDDVGRFAQCRHEDDRHVGDRGSLLEAPAGLKAVEPRHHGVEQNDVGRHPGANRKRGGASRRDQGREARLLEGVGQHRERVRRVVDEQHDVAHRFGGAFSHRAPPRDRPRTPRGRRPPAAPASARPAPPAPVPRQGS